MEKPVISLSKDLEKITAEFEFTGKPNRYCWKVEIKNGQLCDGGCTTGFTEVENDCQVTTDGHYSEATEEFNYSDIGVPNGKSGHAKVKVQASDTRCNHLSGWSPWYQTNYWNPH